MQQVKELPACPVETTLMLIGDKWKVLILRDLMPGTKRFGELKKSIGSVSQKVLTAQLRDMEEKGLVSRKVYAEVPPRVEYSLTALGKSLKPILDAMWTWGENYKAQNMWKRYRATFSKAAPASFCLLAPAGTFYIRKIFPLLLNLPYWDCHSKALKKW